MARKRPDAISASTHKSLTPPGLFLVRMLVFLTLVAFLAAILHEQLAVSVMTNPGLNGLIIGVLFIGIIYSFRQVIRLYPEIRFVNAFRISDPGLASGHQPVLLAPMATMLRDRTGALSLSTVSMRTIMDSIASRLDEARDTGRYMVGLLVFLGLLGTFWGLLTTIRSVGDIIGGMSVGTDAVAMFEALKTKLDEPLGGMATSFSTSLFGLAGSLVVGFLDLQSGHAQNRFYNELEEWLSNVTRIPSGMPGDGDGSVPAYVQALLEQTAESLDRMQRAVGESERERRATVDQLSELSHQLNRLSELIGRESRGLSTVAETQDDLRTLVRQLAQRPNEAAQFSEDLRSELRLMSRTIAAALGGHKAD